jgi:formylmethanofuran dehydrogenase subunit A
MLDLVIKGGTVIDGSGRPGVRTDVGIKDGRVVKIGEVTEDTAKTIDATGKIVPRASSTSTPTTTRRRSGTPTSRRPRCTASPP